MSRHDALTDLEALVLVTLTQLGEGAYGMSIQRAMRRATDRTVSIAGLYACLERLEARRLVSSWHSEPIAVRGGRARRHFRLEAAGARALLARRRATEKIWNETLPILRRLAT